MKKAVSLILLLAALCCLGAFSEDAPIGAVATEEEMTDVIDMDLEGVVPVTAEMLSEGVYSVSVDSSSAMFKIVSCSLTVSGDTITARLYMKSQAYSHIYPGSAQEAAGTGANKLIPLQEDETGLYFELPIDALDSAYTCAAFSVRKQVWYPRTLVFRSDSLPLEAFSAERLITADSLGLSDGQYECEAALEGKGRTTVLSPALITVINGKCTAHTVFSTAKIDYIIVNEEKYVPVTVEGGAAFDIPVGIFDQKISLVVDSTAIKPATEVAYSITFFSETLSPANEDGSDR